MDIKPMDPANRLSAAAADVAGLRALTEHPERRAELRAWQAARLERTHADLLASPRYRAATRFFLDELYGSKDFSQRDAELARVIPALVKFLPNSALVTIADAVELDALSERLDLSMVRALQADAQLGDQPIDAPAYVRAYCQAGAPADRQRQIELVDHVGRTLDGLVRHPMIGALLKTMARPAQLAGLGAMQDFLSRGFVVFRDMRGADAFLQVLVERETQLMRSFYAGEPEPFSTPL
jgi:hypothetical protein